MCLSWTNKGLNTINMHGAITKIILCMFILHTATNETYIKNIREKPDEEISQIFEMKQQCMKQVYKILRQ